MLENNNPFGKLGITVRLAASYEEAVTRTKAALKEEGFGILTEIDVRATLKEKIGVDFRPYAILGACNPPLAHRALTASRAAGLLLPCNVVVEQDGDGALVSAMDPEAGLGILGDESLATIATEAKERLCRALESLEKS